MFSELLEMQRQAFDGVLDAEAVVSRLQRSRGGSLITSSTTRSTVGTVPVRVKALSGAELAAAQKVVSTATAALSVPPDADVRVADHLTVAGTVYVVQWVPKSTHAIHTRLLCGALNSEETR